MELMTRGELAKKTGVSPAAIRYYEEHNILPTPRRRSNGYRFYTEDYVVKIQLIKDAKTLGYSLKEIAEIMEMLSQDIELDTLRKIVHLKHEEIERKIKSLRLIQDLLSNLLKTPEKKSTSLPGIISCTK
ncbi:MerR family transcriptional regulator [Bacillus pumilus]|nr:MerR family transcriptional regulator [Bacillus pumilus]MCW4683038.1 MerR family transcriptional regulator [Bacillus pumilus]MCY7577386.1 MerR family transcriptional regulator [Bacillus pumilus]OBS87475.1 transcriptional regulator [Bacillus pumilus]